ncbi:hypothetical protein LVJ94_07045 [Pendulispora rubella]|uniref:RNA polymerase sigma factor 70 region 4 type 2 domain-containing protein n=1 Tax=Pendulispora rubella TaxID=2741070 RepID=A0ABZ2LE22_9BACT
MAAHDGATRFSRNALDVDLDEIASACTSQARLSELRRLYAIVGDLPADVRIPLVLHRVEEMGLAEIANMTNMSLSTVKRRIREGDDRLRAHLGDGEEGAQ